MCRGVSRKGVSTKSVPLSFAHVERKEELEARPKRQVCLVDYTCKLRGWILCSLEGGCNRSMFDLPTMFDLMRETSCV